MKNKITKLLLGVALLALIPATAFGQASYFDKASRARWIAADGYPLQLGAEDTADGGIQFYVEDANQCTIKDGEIAPVTNSDVDLGTAALSFEDVFAEKALLDNDSAAALDADVSTATTALPLLGVSGTSGTQAHVALVQNIASAQGADLFALKTRAAAGSTNANTIISSGDDILKIRAFGANGTAYDEAAQILLESGGTPGASADMPGQIRFLLSADASATPAEVAKWGPTGLFTAANGITVTAGDVIVTSGDVSLVASGKTLEYETGTAASACMGSATVNGTTAVTVSTTCAVTGSRIFLTRITDPSGGAGNDQLGVFAGNIQNGVSFDVDSTDADDSGQVNWVIFHEAP